MKACVVFFHKNIKKIYQKEWIEKCINSVLFQDYKDFDIFEVNYGNENDSILQDKILDGKRHFFYMKNYPDHTYAMNFIIDTAFSSGYDIVFNTNLDDFYSLDRFSKSVEKVKQGYDLVSSYWYYINPKDESFLSFDENNLFLNLDEYGIPTQESIKDRLINYNQNVINHSGICMTRKFWNSYDHNLNRLIYTEQKPFEDLILWQKAVLGGMVKLFIIPDRLIYYRIHSSQICNNSRIENPPVYPGIIKKRIGILMVATGKYKLFLDKTLQQIQKNFLPGYQHHYFLFIDSEIPLTIKDNLTITIINRRGFPGDTLYRYHYFLTQRDNLIQKTDVIYYFDVDMGIWEEIGSGILPTPKTPLVGVKHPGFYTESSFQNPWGSPETNPLSKAFIPKNKLQNVYIAGGFNGGYTRDFIKMSEEIKQDIDIDDSKEIIAVWHDESHLNRYFSFNPTLFKILMPEYCYPEGKNIGFKPKIVALNKDHSFYRMSEKYITIDLMGGLGNLLFQYSTTLATGIKNNLVPVFNIIHPYNKKSYRNSILSNIFRLELKNIKFKKYIEKRFCYDSIEISSNDENIELNGYFQSWKYFHEFKPQIKKSLNLESSRINNLYDIIIKLFNSNTVAVHVRRGDYLTLAEYHTNLSENYYSKALSYFPEDYTFCIFSDDINWCKNTKCFRELKHVYFVEGNKEEEDFILMSKCQNFIIANSSFSWWSAYLSESLNVIYPNKWFSFFGPHFVKEDYVLPGWRGLDDLDPGLSFIIRAKNESLNVNLCLSSLLPLCFEFPNQIEIIYVDNNSQDSTFIMAKDFEKYKQIKVYKYPTKIAKCGPDHVKAVNNGGKSSVATFYNWCINRATKTNIIKWDADFIAIIDNLREMILKFNLINTRTIFNLWCSGETMFIDSGEFYLKKNSYYDEFRCFSKHEGFSYINGEDKTSETPNTTYVSYLPKIEIQNNKQELLSFIKNIPHIYNFIDFDGNAETYKYFKIENNSVVLNWKDMGPGMPSCIPGIKDVYLKPVFYELKRTNLDEFDTKDIFQDSRDSIDFKIFQDLKKGIVPDNVIPLKQNTFYIIIPSYNCLEFIKKCLFSLQCQEYKHFKVFVIDDASTDSNHTEYCLNKCLEMNWTFIKNNSNHGALRNIVMGINIMKPEDDDIIITLDGDDWLNNSALQILNLNYQDDTELTYGRFLYYNPKDLDSHDSMGFSESVSQEIIKKKSFRDIHWIFSHLRSFKYKLWKNIKDQDLRDTDGIYFNVTWDMAFMYPMLEMANKIKYINYPMYHYNISHPLNDFKIKKDKQELYEKKIRSMLRY